MSNLRGPVKNDEEKVWQNAHEMWEMNFTVCFPICDMGNLRKKCEISVFGDRMEKNHFIIWSMYED